MAGLGELIQRLFSRAPTFEPAPPLATYPSSDDAAYARAQGFGYGDPRMDTSAGTARVLGAMMPARDKQPMQFQARSGAGMTPAEAAGAATSDAASRNMESPEIADVFRRAALTANRIPIAALGFDPTRMVADTQIKNPTVGGIYSPTSDSIYFNTAGAAPSSPVHESIHRGIEMLGRDPANAKAIRDLPGEEYVVRWLMAKQAGDPEKGGGSVGDAQRESAVKLFTGLGENRYRIALDQLTRAAEDAIAQRRPGGPR